MSSSKNNECPVCHAEAEVFKQTEFLAVPFVCLDCAEMFSQNPNHIPVRVGNGKIIVAPRETVEELISFLQGIPE